MSYTPAIFATSFCYVLDKLCPGNRMSISAKLAVERLRMTFYPFSWSMEFWAGTGKPCKSRVSCVVPIITHYQGLRNAHPLFIAFRQCGNAAVGYILDSGLPDHFINLPLQIRSP